MIESGTKKAKIIKTENKTRQKTKWNEIKAKQQKK